MSNLFANESNCLSVDGDAFVMHVKNVKHVKLSMLSGSYKLGDKCKYWINNYLFNRYFLIKLAYIDRTVY